jgi:hypothetical protein
MPVVCKARRFPPGPSVEISPRKPRGFLLLFHLPFSTPKRLKFLVGGMGAPVGCPVRPELVV